MKYSLPAKVHPEKQRELPNHRGARRLSNRKRAGGDPPCALKVSFPAQITEYAFGARKRAVFLDVLSLYCGSSLSFTQIGCGPKLPQLPRWVARSLPPVK